MFCYETTHSLTHSLSKESEIAQSTLPLEGSRKKVQLKLNFKRPETQLFQYNTAHSHGSWDKVLSLSLIGARRIFAGMSKLEGLENRSL